MGDAVTIVEMAPRDGLQNETAVIATADKIAFVDLLSATGLMKIEVASFVSPKWVPQMADGAEVMAGIARRPGVTYAALTPNLKGLTAAIAARADEAAIFASASESFSRSNINCSIAESLERFAPLAARAKEAGLALRGYVSCVTDCPYEGHIAPDAVADVASVLLDLGCHEISLGDTIGQGTPETIEAMLSAVLERIPASRLAGHFHDTAGRAMDNIRVSLKRGLRTFDASAGGLGGCPYAPGAKGNVDTVKVVEMLEAEGLVTGVDRAALAKAARFARSLRPSR
ncbi:hydroxymethylglutaryl-CoA lyase [Jiella mangrovi]|uniref:Hydroxymethylglutaryl-CoA lyase n=1 Tax=Jiella mangrovi TaxID=2821407 RepID=A0ABS4BGJ0_9HYPH|nr:hydroxymethylglutaryl-CoA lyase [Jiella mangrovi]MBP0615867.1 hydroxymethylglutaryl-CoA lyase [Jiella mangrovi]